MKLQIKEICEAQGIKSAYELAKRTKLNMPTAYRAFANDIKQFTPQTLKALCDALKCSPSDVFGYNEPQKVKRPSVPDVAKKAATEPPTFQESTSGKGMTTEQVAKRLEPIAGKILSNRRILDYVKSGKLKSEQSGNRKARFFSEADYLEFETWYEANILKQK
jgi:DNA-binding Xre family transcriptional regulator